MGLFSKKPKSIIVAQPGAKPASGDEAMDRLEELLPMVESLPQLAKPPASEPPPPKAKPMKAPKANKKFSVDPTDFLALRAELIDMKARLDESEQARAIVEARLSSLDAAASQFATERNDITEVANMVIQLQQQVAERAHEGGSAGASSASDGAHDELSAKVDALQNRFFGLQDPTPKLAEFESQISQLRSELEAATAAAAEAAALPPPPPSANGPDPETLERIAAVQQRVNDLDQIRHRLGEIDHFKQRMGEIDALHQRVAGVEALHERIGELDNVDQRLAAVDGLAMQLQQLNARVAAQAELGGQVSALRDRVGQLSDQPRGADDDIRLQLQEIGERLRASEEMQVHVATLLERSGSSETEARAVREHMALLDQRLTNVSTELANQLSELGRDIDGLGQRVPEVAEGVVNDEVVDALRGGQVKLANEQARYEIAFREDLAALAEQLRKGRPSS
jgi:DNA repair exonuclease SbcCD ATPase subunit